MIRRLGALVALLACACSPGYMHRSDDAFAVLTQDGAPICSAFAVGPHDVMTAAHCVDDPDAELALVSKELWDHTSNGFATVSIVYVDEARDLALLRTPLTFGDFVRLRAPMPGEVVTAVSAYAGWRRSSGRVLPGDPGFFRDTDVTIKHGWSGSPVLGFDGAAVGVVHSCYGEWISNRHVCAENDMQFTVLP